jgi:ATP-dependent Zn protease
MMSNYQRTQWEMRRVDADRRRDANREDISTAQHEAGHAIVGILLGLTPRSITIEPGFDSEGATTWARVSGSHGAFENIVVRVAGSEAERMFGSADEGHARDLELARVIAPLIDDDVDDVIGRARIAARKILKTNFTALALLAVALIGERTLDLAEIEEIIAADAPDDDASDGGDDDADAPSIFDRDVILARMLDRQRRALDRDHGCDVILTRLLDPKIVHFTRGEIL